MLFRCLFRGRYPVTGLHATVLSIVGVFALLDVLAEVVSSRVPTTASCIRFQVGTCGIFGGQSGTRAGFLEVLQFLLPVFIPPSASYSLIIVSSTIYRCVIIECHILRNVF
jgi:hypothetical protein